MITTITFCEPKYSLFFDVSILSYLSSKIRWAAPKVVPSILLCCPTLSEKTVFGMAVEVELSRQYSITFCFHVTDSSSGTVWQNGIWHGSAYKTNVSHRMPPYKRHCTHWHSVTLNIYGDQTNSGCERSEAVGGMFQQSGSPLLMRIFLSVAGRLLCYCALCICCSFHGNQ